jgi:hypothetical protein
MEGKKNPAEGPSRRPDNKIRYERLTARLLATLANNTIEPYDHHPQKITTAQAVDALAADVNRRIVGTPIVLISDLQRMNELEDDLSDEWKVTTGVLTYEGRIYVPKDDLLCNKVISVFHDNPESGHFGALKTGELLSRDFYWPVLDATVRKYIANCKLCH